MITTIGVMIVTSLSVARERENKGTLDQLLVSPLTTADFRRQKRCRHDCRDLRYDRASYRHWAYQIPFAGSLALFLFHDGDLRAAALVGF